MSFDNVDQVLNDLKSKYSQNGGFQQKEPTSDDLLGDAGIIKRQRTTADGTPIVRPVDYKVNPLAIYDRLRDGSYVAKFENYLGEEGNEDRLAREQSASEQWWNGLQKLGKKSLNYAFDATVGTVYGIFKGISDGDFSSVWDNDFSNWMDDVNKRMDYEIPNYYTDEQKSMGVLESMGTANFWANDFMGGLAFVAGALLPEAAIALGSGGTSLGVGLAKIGAKTAGKKLVKEGAESSMKTLARKGLNKVDDTIKYNAREEAADAVRALRRANFGNSVGKKLNTARFLVQSSNFEAGMEARHNFHDAVDNYIADYKERNGRAPSLDELNEFTKDAVHSANWVYGGNMAILGVSNAAMFGKTFNVGLGFGKRANNIGNRLVGLGVKKGEKGALALQKSNRFRKVTGNTYKLLSKPATEGLYEEGLQGVAGSTMQNYLEAKYNPESEDAYGLWASFTDAMAHQYGSKEGWKEMAIGMLIGFGAPMIQGQAPPGLMSDSYRSRRKQLEKQIDVANKSRGNILSRMNGATALANLSSKAKSKAENGADVSVDNTLINSEFIKTNESVRSHNQIKKDYNAIVDNMELTSDQIEEIGEENIDAYKDSLKEEFKKDLEDHTFAKKSVESLGLNRTLKDTPGNIAEIGDAVYTNIMMGRSSLRRAKIIASQIDAVVGSQGVFNHLEHYNNLSEDKKAKLKELKKKQRQYNAATERANKYGRQLAGMTREGSREFTDKTKQKRYNEASERRVKVQQEMETLNDEIDTLKKDLEADLATENFDLTQTVTTDVNTHDVLTMVNELDKLEEFSESLKRNGREQDHFILMGMIEDFKINSDAHREMNNMVRKMYDTNFFSTKEGRGLRKMVAGDKYKMSDEFRKIIRDNDQAIDKSLRMVGFRNTGKTAEELIEDVMGPKNEELSDREKYRLESLIRVQLGYNKLQIRLNNIAENQDIPTTEDISTRSPLKGDTIALVQALDADKKDLSNVSVIGKMINQILGELSKFEIGKVNTKKIEKLKAKISKLEEARDKALSREKEEIDSYKFMDPISKEEFEDFRDNNKVSKERLKDISMKEKKKESLSKKEKDIRKGKSEEIEKLMASESSEIESELQKTKDELKSEESSKTIKIIDSEDYRRLNALNKKKVNQELSDQEKIELEELEEDIDQWITISGIVVEGLRLSDLIKQKAVIENSNVTPLEDVGEISSQDKLNSIQIKDKNDRVYASIGQSYGAVTATGTKTKDGEPAVEISGISPESLAEEVGFDFEYETNKQNNVIITEDVQRRINEESSISILPTNKNLATNYSVVLKENTDGTIEPLMSSFRTDFSEEQIIDSIYDMSEGEQVSLEIDPKDPHNVELINNYKKARSEKGKEKALNALREGLVIRVRSNGGDFVAVLKSKRSGGSKGNDYNKLAALRDTLMDDETILDDLISGIVREGEDLEIGTVTVEKTLPGQPNFNLSKDEEGQVSIDSKSLTKKDIEKIDDIGYLQDGEVKSRDKRGDIDMTFFGSKMRDKSGTKYPFVVLNIGNKRIAYPVTMEGEAQNQESIEEFERVYNSDTGIVDKAVALNKILASKGIDIKQPGNAFVAIGKDNMNDKFFSEKLAQLKSINYFSNLDQWISRNNKIEDSLSEGVSIDINLSKPFHSPKLKLDFSELNVSEVTIKSDSKPSASKDKNVGKGASRLSAAIKGKKNKKC